MSGPGELGDTSARVGTRYEIVAGELAIGWSELESGDPPMGVALGRLHPTPAYNSSSVQALLRVRPVGGAFLDPSGGVHIEDLSDELGPDAIEVSVLGLSRVVYEEHFPHHVRAYEEHFKNP